MKPVTQELLRQAIDAFAFELPAGEAERFGAGHINDTFAWSLYVRYNIEDGDLEETGGFFQYNLDCIAFRLNVDYLTSYTTDDGWKHDSDFRISLGFWLRAFPHDEDEDWMDWASLADR